MPTGRARWMMVRGALFALLMMGATHVVQAQECYYCCEGECCEGECYDPLHQRDQFTPAGTNVVVVNVDSFFSEATQVASSGSTDADFCVAPDPREVDVTPTKHVYTPRQLALRELSGKGSCTGSIPTDNGGRTSWEQLLGQVDLRIDPWYRAFKSKYQGVTGYWVVLGIVRSSAQFRGPVVSAPYPEALVNYAPFNSVNGYGELSCNTTVDKRPLTLSGNVPAFNEPANIEGNRMILDTILCDAGQAATRQSTHAYMMRLDSSYLDEAINITNVLAGLALTVNQAASCSNSASQPAIVEMRRRLGTAALAILLKRWDNAIADLEQIARLAKNNVTGCSDYYNYKGALMARALTGSFTVFDRFKHRDPNTWDMYTIPPDLGVPNLLATSE